LLDLLLESLVLRLEVLDLLVEVSACLPGVLRNSRPYKGGVPCRHFVVAVEHLGQGVEVFDHLLEARDDEARRVVSQGNGVRVRVPGVRDEFPRAQPGGDLADEGLVLDQFRQVVVQVEDDRPRFVREDQRLRDLLKAAFGVLRGDEVPDAAPHWKGGM